MTESKSRKQVTPKSKEKSPNENEERSVEEELNEELMSLYELCERTGVGEQELLAPLFSVVSAARLRQRLTRLGVVLGGLALALLFVFSLPPLANFFEFVMRNQLIKVLPYWDWTEHYHADCLVSNPYYIGDQLLEEDCLVCESLENVERLSNVSVSEVSSQYIKNDIPFIVSDGTRDWDIMHTDNFFFDNITQLYLNDPRLDGVVPCTMASNLRGKRDDLKGALRKILGRQPQRWFIHWENCHKQAAKILRSLYTRPYFLPLMIDMSDSNWVLMSSNYLGKVYRELPSITPMLVLAQVRGYNSIQLSAREPCQGVCPTIQDTLAEGEVLVFTDFLWRLDYIPGADSDNLAIAVGGSWE